MGCQLSEPMTSTYGRVGSKREVATDETVPKTESMASSVRGEGQGHLNSRDPNRTPGAGSPAFRNRGDPL
jgi:hypothetical protein